MPDLPGPVAAYFASDTAADVETLAAIFATDAIVEDEAKTHRGLAAIRAWRVDTMTRTPFTARPLRAEERDGRVVVPTEVSGSFPGSPLTLEHRFTLRDGRISALEIA
ncbi:nuclear transport factor 2 family protein [Enterovirga sp. CN4-39]|uniref:nuclear transport factor 2 family protein n=1 Tax=Enterovirga sp. CN4-39 TaxID=3400910 RepID=UPI003C05D072